MILLKKMIVFFIFQPYMYIVAICATVSAQDFFTLKRCIYCRESIVNGVFRERWFKVRMETNVKEKNEVLWNMGKMT